MIIFPFSHNGVKGDRRESIIYKEKKIISKRLIRYFMPAKRQSGNLIPDFAGVERAQRRLPHGPRAPQVRRDRAVETAMGHLAGLRVRVMDGFESGLGRGAPPCVAREVD